MNINTLNTSNTNDSINIVEQERNNIINTTKIETQTVLEKLKTKKEIIAWKALIFAENNDSELKTKLINVYSAIYKNDTREAIDIRNNLSDLAKKATWDKKRLLVELCAGFYNNSIPENSIFLTA